jgi:transposase
MPRGKPNKQYSGEFKQKVVEDMRNNGLSQCEVAEKYDITRSVIQRWERIYLEEGPEGLYVEHRGRSRNGGRPPKLDKKVEEDLITEVQRLRAENDYLKKLNALVLEEERRSKRRK